MSDQEIDLPEGFGVFNPNAGSYERWKLPKENGSLVLRIFPPMKSLARRGDCGIYWKTHFGWNGRDPVSGKSQWRPFLCIEEKRGGMTTAVCGACEERYKFEAKIKAIKDRGAELKKSDGDIKKAIAPHAEWLYDHSLNGKFRMPACDLQEKCGIVEIPYGLSKKFKEKVREATAKGMDPLGIKGIYWEFKRTGKASPNSDDVYPYQTPIEGVEGGFRIKTHTLTKTLAQQAMDIIPDLYELQEKGRIRPDQIDALVASSGDPDEVDRILEIDHSKAKTNDWTPAEETPKPDSKSVADDAFPTDDVSKSTKSEPVQETKSDDSTIEDEEAALAVEMAAVKARMDAVVAAAAARKLAAKKDAPKDVDVVKAKEPTKSAKSDEAVSAADFDDVFGS